MASWPMTGQFFVLTALAGASRHGYGIVGEAAELPGGRVLLKIGSLCGVLHRLAAGTRWLPRRAQRMPFQRPPHLPSVLASVLAAGLMLTVASCSRLTPLGPDPAATMPQPHQLRSPFTLQAMRIQPPTSAGGCPAGDVTLPGGGNPGTCYRTATSVTITSAAVSPVSPFQPPTPPGQQQAVPVQYVFWITLPAADTPALTAVTTAVTGPQPPHPGPPTARAANSALTIIVAGRTWILVGFATRFAGRQFQASLPSRNQALQLQRTLAASG